MFKKIIGDKSFYRRVLTVAVPIIIQNFITNFVSLLDNIMVGQMNTAAMSGVAIVNQLLFIFNLCVFGAVSGAGIFTAQFYGSGDNEGIRRSFRFKLYAGVMLSAAGAALLFFAGTPLIGLYLKGEGNPADAALTLHYGLSYLQIMLLGLLPFALTNAYSSTLRETGETVVPMIAGIVAVLVNLSLNYLLIFGKFGIPSLGVQGAAIATVISRYVELSIVAVWAHTHKEKAPYITGLYRSFHIPVNLLKKIFLCSLPLMLNECLWSIGVAFLNQSYSIRGLDVVAATNISNTIFNLGSVIFLSMGAVMSILIGRLLGAGADEQTVRTEFRRIAAISVGSCFIMGLLLIATSGLFPMIYNTTDNVRNLAASFICISACFMPFNAYVHSVYFALRSGGKTLITFVFDSGFMWVVNTPLAYILSRYTNLPILPLYALCLSTDLLKCVIGTILIRQKNWMHNLTKL